MTTVFKKDASGNLLAPSQEPFSSKAITAGKLFRRKHGFKSTTIAAGAEGVVNLVVPYAQVKINEIELTNARVGDTVDFKVLDTAAGLLTGVPNFMLNQFAFNAEMPDGFYRDTSNYDADLVLGMQIQVTYKNNGDTDHIVRGNITYHELKT